MGISISSNTISYTQVNQNFLILNVGLIIKNSKKCGSILNRADLVGLYSESNKLSQYLTGRAIELSLGHRDPTRINIPKSALGAP